MPNDQKISELISKSLSATLTNDQQRTIDEKIAASQQSRNYAKLSKMINDSLSDVGKRSRDGDTSVAPGLSADAALRMKQSIRLEAARSSQFGITVTGAAFHDSAISSTHAMIQQLPISSHADERSLKSRFTLTRELGKGGLGTVWLARDERLLRSVALKEMNAEAAEHPRAWERFRREAEITGRLEHPNIVPLYQFGTDETTGQPFYAMRFVGKRTLVDAIEEYHDKKIAGEDVTMDLHRLLTAFIGVCQAIAYAHSRGVIHRDLKPENVALDNFGQVIVLDWGLAKVNDGNETEGHMSGVPLSADSSFTKTMAGEVIGTPLYMAPEQAAGQLDKVDSRTDVYGLGAILFAMLTASAPHQNSSVQEGNAVPIAQLLKQISGGATPRPRDYMSGIPADLEAICVKAMQFKPHSRYQSAAEVADAVQQWMAGRSERRQKYSNSRSEARELRTAMMSAVRDLERNVRFMSSLPPIQGIVNSIAGRRDDEQSVLRSHLSVIFSGLLKTNCDFCAVSFAKADGSKFQELVRIERPIDDVSNVRSIPASRLVSGNLTSCMKKALAGKPDEVFVALSSECPDPTTASWGKSPTPLLAATVPVFDDETEEPFGFVRIEASLERLIENEIRGRFHAINRLYVLDNDCKVLMQLDSSGSRVKANDGQSMSSIAASWDSVVPMLKLEGEFVDNQDHAFYATRIDLVPGRYSLALGLCLAEKQTK
ncbi:MAG: serine/threonine-protein kinase [Fuerstiella sp.]